ncbi:MAG: integration host factor [Deltaproteobacteria bacterium RIFOXYA12_FULL_61_11]|nr:MAG: integration host factor [Deltaproteobacteria bacterium RIFOXYA12_FULL_61_11]
MTKAELINNLTDTLKHRDLTKTVINEVCDVLFDTLAKGIKKDKRFTYPGFGTWTVKKRAARTGRNPQTGDTIKIKASKTVGFKPAPKFKNAI